MGKQKVGALSTILGFYGVGLPVGVPLMFSAKLGIKGTFLLTFQIILTIFTVFGNSLFAGLWIGFCACLFLQSCILVVYLARINWEQVTLEVLLQLYADFMHSGALRYQLNLFRDNARNSNQRYLKLFLSIVISGSVTHLVQTPTKKKKKFF